MNVNNLIKGIFLLVLGVSGNFVAETLGCKTQKLLSENMFAKHIVIYLIIYFALGFTSDENPYPTDVAKNALIIWILFIFFTRMSLPFTIIGFSLIAIRYILHTFVEYYEKDSKDKNKKIIHQINTFSDYLERIIMLVILIGFTLYFKKQYNDYYKSWSTLKFIFGVNKCKSLQ